MHGSRSKVYLNERISSVPYVNAMNTKKAAFRTAFLIMCLFVEVSSNPLIVDFHPTIGCGNSSTIPSQVNDMLDIEQTCESCFSDCCEVT